MNLLDVSTNGLAERVVFVLLGGGAIAGALFTITRRNPITAVMSLVATFFAIAGIYATLWAHFLAVIQVLVYAGAIMVLFIFVVMILNREEIAPVSFRGIVTRALGVLAGGYVVLVAARVVLRGRATELLHGRVAAPGPGYGTVATVGRSLFTEFVFPFEAISLLLLVAIVGGVIVSRSAHEEEMAETIHRRKSAVRGAIRAESIAIGSDGEINEQGAPDHGAASAHH